MSFVRKALPLFLLPVALVALGLASACQGGSGGQGGGGGGSPSPEGTVSDAWPQGNAGVRKVVEDTPTVLDVELPACAVALKALVTRNPSEGEGYPIETRAEGPGCQTRWKLNLIALPVGRFEVGLEAEGNDGKAFVVPAVKVLVEKAGASGGGAGSGGGLSPSPTPASGDDAIEPDLSCGGSCDDAIDAYLARAGAAFSFYESLTSGASRVGRIFLTRDASKHRSGTFEIRGASLPLAFTSGVFDVTRGYLVLREQAGRAPVLFRYFPLESNGSTQRMFFTKFPLRGGSGPTVDLWVY